MFLFPFLLLCSVCLNLVTFVPNVASVSGLSILDFPYGFLSHLFNYGLCDSTQTFCFVCVCVCSCVICVSVEFDANLPEDEN